STRWVRPLREPGDVALGTGEEELSIGLVTSTDQPEGPLELILPRALRLCLGRSSRWCPPGPADCAFSSQWECALVQDELACAGQDRPNAGLGGELGAASYPSHTGGTMSVSKRLRRPLLAL